MSRNVIQQGSWRPGGSPRALALELDQMRSALNSPASFVQMVGAFRADNLTGGLTNYVMKFQATDAAAPEILLPGMPGMITGITHSPNWDGADPGFINGPITLQAGAHDIDSNEILSESLEVTSQADVSLTFAVPVPILSTREVWVYLSTPLTFAASGTFFHSYVWLAIHWNTGGQL